MPRKDALALIRAFGLPPDEEAALVYREVLGLNYTQICQEMNISRETLGRIRRRAFSRIVQLINQLRPCPTPAYLTCNPWASQAAYGSCGTCNGY